MPLKPATMVLALLACLVVAGCADRAGSAEDDRRGGFYSGIGGGVTRP